MGNQAEMYRMKHNMLFNMWKGQNKHDGNVFNIDGIVNPDVWYSQGNKKILFLLKEAYHDDNYMEECGIEYDLTKNLRENNIQGPTWNRVSEWVYGISNTTSLSIPEYTKLNEEKQKEFLNKIAVVNLKKSNGKSVSDDEDISEYVASDIDLLKIQISDISPDIIICGNTFKWLKEIIGKDEIIEEIGTWVHKWGNIIIIDYYHPANQFPSILNFYGLLGIYQKAVFDEINMAENEAKNEVKENKKEYELINTYIDSGEYEKADMHLDRLVEDNPNDAKAWILKADIIFLKGTAVDLKKIIKYYKKAIDGNALDEEYKEKINAGIQKYISSQINIIGKYFIGKIGFDLVPKKEEFVNAVKQIINDIADLNIEPDVFAKYKKEIYLKEVHVLIDIRKQLKERAKNNWKLFALGENYVKFKSSIYLLTDMLVEAIDMCYEEEWEERIELYEKVIIAWCDEDIYYASNYPGNNYMAPIISILNLEKDYMKEKKQNILELMESIRKENDEEYAKAKEEEAKEWNKQVKVEFRSKYKK